jgi:hypothetical protein
MFEIEGKVVRSHYDEHGIHVIDEVEITGVGYHPGRDCLCRRCSDDCITVTGSEYCGDCEISFYNSHQRPCH